MWSHEVVADFYHRFVEHPDVSDSTFGVKYGGGIDIPFKEFFAWNIDVSRMSYGHPSVLVGDGRVGGLNISAGIVIKMGE